MEIRRFGPGHRRPEGPPGTRGVTGQVIHADARGVVSELAFGPQAMISPHANPNTSYFIVISGGGYVQVGDERSRINHGEAVLWPPDILHGAFTDGSEMRVLIVEFAGADDSWARGIVEGTSAVRQLGPTGAGERGTDPDGVATDPDAGTADPGDERADADRPVERARGRLADPGPAATGRTGTGEPW